MSLLQSAQLLFVAIALMGVAFPLQFFFRCLGRDEYYSCAIKMVDEHLYCVQGRRLTWKDSVSDFVVGVARRPSLTVFRAATGLSSEDHVPWARRVHKEANSAPFREFYIEQYENAKAISDSPYDVGDPDSVASSEFQSTRARVSVAYQQLLEQGAGGSAEVEYLAELRRASKKPSMVAWIRRMRAYPDDRPRLALLIPPLNKFLDYVGRGTAVGLLVGLLLEGGQWLNEEGDWATLSIAGGLVGGAFHGMTFAAATTGVGNSKFARQHPYLSYLMAMMVFFVLEMFILWLLSKVSP